MSVPVVGTKIGAGTLSSAATTLVLTTTAGAAVGTIVLVLASNSVSVPTGVTDSKGNTWVLVASDANRCALFGCLVTIALATSDTITIAASSGIITGMAIVHTLIAPNQVRIASTPADSSTGLTGSDATMETTALATAREQDAMFVVLAAANNNPLRTFSSVDSSYTIFDQQAAGTVAGYSIAYVYKTVTATNPMPSQAPIVTLSGTASTWRAMLVMLAGVTAMGSIGARAGQGAGSTSYVPGLGATHINIGQRAKTMEDGFPQPVVPIVVKRPLSGQPDYTIVSE